MIKKVYIIIIIIILVFLPSCKKNNNEFINKSDILLDTFVNIKIYNPKENDEELINNVFNLIKELENTLSVHNKDSEIYRMKQNAGKGYIEISEDTYSVIKKSIEYSVLSEGYFDITAGPLIKLWNIDPPEGYVPTTEELDIVLAKIDYNKILFDDNKIMLKETGMIANLGAIAKGYIADKVKEYLISNGVEHGIINLGGNILLIGGKPDGNNFRIGIQDPDSGRQKYLGVIDISDFSVVSSGDYERFFIDEKGNKYHHILNPYTGYPATNNLKQVSIISKISMDGDALSTATFLLGLEKGMKLIEDLDNIEAIFITKDNNIWLSSGMEDDFEFDNLNYDDKYKVQVNK